jgi:hypothetical protein
VTPVEAEEDNPTVVREESKRDPLTVVPLPEVS